MIQIKRISQSRDWQPAAPEPGILVFANCLDFSRYED